VIAARGLLEIITDLIVAVILLVGVSPKRLGETT
jgi:hypothetical protein